MSNSRFTFSLAETDGLARTGSIRMRRGEIRTPAFMPVGTTATIKAMKPADVRAAGADIILGNTYHLMLRPGAERIAKLGGLHGFMGWNRPILTDSGGYQVMSLSGLTKVSEEGVAFASHIDGSRHMLNPERSMEIQTLLGSDIVMAFDQLVKTTDTPKAQAVAMERSMRWAKRSRTAFDDFGNAGCSSVSSTEDSTKRFAKTLPMRSVKSVLTVMRSAVWRSGRGGRRCSIASILRPANSRRIARAI